MNDPHGICRKGREVVRSEQVPLAWDREEEGDITGKGILPEEEISGTPALGFNNRKMSRLIWFNNQWRFT